MQRFQLILLSLLLYSGACAPTAEESVFGTVVEPVQDAVFTGTVYFLEEGTGALPDLTTLTPVGTVFTQTLDISPRSFEAGFPGITERFEWFALRYEAVVEITTSGDYQFRLLSDDGSRLYLDGKLVIDNDGIHPPTAVTETVTLTPGAHRLTVDYFQGPRAEITLQLFVTPPGGAETVFSTQGRY